MSVSAQETIFQYVGNGVSTTFAYNCQVLQANDLFVYVNGAEITSGITKNGIGSLTGGAVVFSVAPATGVQIILEREVALERTTDYQQNGDFLARVVNPDFNRIWMALQQAFTSLNRALRFPKSDVNPVTELPGAAARADKLLSFDSSGNPVVIAPAAQSATALSILLATSAGSSLIGFIQAGVGAILRTLQVKARESVSIADYGAVTTDLTGVVNNAAIVAALADNDTVLVPPGLFYVTGSINAKNKAIIGVDALSSALKLVGANTNTSLFVNGGTIGTAWGAGGGIVLRNLRLIGNWDGATANAETDISLIGGLVKWWAASYLKIQNCTVEYFYGFGIFSYMMGYSEISSNHIFVGGKNGLHLEAPDGNNAITSTIVSNNSIHSIRGTGLTGGSGIYLKNVFTCPTFDNIIEDVVNGITIDGQDNRNPTLLANHIEQNTGPGINVLGSWNKALFQGNILATAPVLFQTNAEFSPYVSINNFGLQDTYALPVVVAAPAQVSLVAATPKTTINSLLLTPGEWDISAAWIGTNSAGTGQLSTRQEFALNTAAAIPAYSSSFDKATLRGDCVSTVDTGNGFLNGSLSLKLRITADTTVYLYGGAASITNTLSIACTGWIKARKVGGLY